MKKTMFASVLLSISAVLAAGPSVTLKSAVQEDDRTVVVSYSLSDGPAVVTFGVETNAGDAEWAAVDAKHLWKAVGDVNRFVHAMTGEFRWTPDHAGLLERFDAGKLRVVLKAWPLADTPDYMTVDLTPGAATYDRLRFYEDASAVPGGILENPVYRTSVLLMRRIPAANVAWTMGSSILEEGRVNDGRETPHEVTLPADYYLGVFPITCGQLSTIMNNGMQWTGFSKESAMRIRDQIHYNQWSPSARNANYPADPADTSLLGKLRALTKSAAAFELPTEAQWEFAARGGHGDGVWGNGVPYAATLPSGTDAGLPGRYLSNQKIVGNTAKDVDVGSGTPIAGSYAPNGYGIYDMHGGVSEWCLDWYQTDIAGLGGVVNISPDDGNKCVDGTPTTWRVVRGGAWCSNSVECRAAHRESREGHYAGDRAESGMRVCCPVSFSLVQEGN